MLLNCSVCGNDISKDAQFCEGCGAAIDVSIASGPGMALRYHGLDALRGMAMLLGIVLHAALPYIPNVQEIWPPDESSSHVVSTIFEFIHIWRMPLFFILAGFFANLVVSRKSWKSWWRNRLLRIGLPIIVFSPLMSLTMPWIFTYGITGEFAFFYTAEGQPFHLWFLWHLIIFVILTAIFRFLHLGAVEVLMNLNRIGLGIIDSILGKSRSVLSGILFRSRFPIPFIIACIIVNFSTGGELILNVGASLLYFGFGYSLYDNPSLSMFLKTHWRYYFLAGMIGFTLFMTVTLAMNSKLQPDIYNIAVASAVETGWDIESLWLIQYLLKIICAVLFSYAFIGLSERRFGSYNLKLRFISDGAYWMYLIHLPIVTLITFSMFSLNIPVGIKFTIAIGATFIICMVT